MALKQDSTLLAVSQPQSLLAITTQQLEAAFADFLKIDVAAGDAS